MFTIFKNSDDWQTITESSNFSICPRGFGTTSFRLYETMQLGTLPIYVWEGEAWLPYSNVIDWSKFALVVGSHEQADLPRKIETANVAQMLDTLSRVKHMFTYNYTIQYILDEVAQEKV